MPDFPRAMGFHIMPDSCCLRKNFISPDAELVPGRAGAARILPPHRQVGVRRRWPMPLEVCAATTPLSAVGKEPLCLYKSKAPLRDRGGKRTAMMDATN